MTQVISLYQSQSFCSTFQVVDVSAFYNLISQAAVSEDRARHTFRSEIVEETVGLDRTWSLFKKNITQTFLQNYS